MDEVIVSSIELIFNKFQQQKTDTFLLIGYAYLMYCHAFLYIIQWELHLLLHLRLTASTLFSKTDVVLLYLTVE